MVDTKTIRRRTPRDKALLVKLTEAEFLQLHHMAETRGLNASSFVRLAVFHPRGHMSEVA
jgi:hypothetical protein